MLLEIYTGTWINWTDGLIRGATLTISSQHGAFLVAFLALFVRFAGSHFWGIFRYLHFQRRSAAVPQDIYHQQQQVVLRNNATDIGALWDLLKIAYAWRERTRGSFFRALSLCFWAGLHIFAFTAAGILSSQATSSGKEVLLQSSNCRTWPTQLNRTEKNTPKSEEEISRIADAHSSFITASNSARLCYDNSSSSLQGCLPYGRRLLTWSKNTSISCPFDPSMCIDDTAVEFDSGYLDSHLDFGINTPLEDRIKFRSVTACAPITVKGFKSQAFSMAQAQNFTGDQVSSDANRTFIEYYYGKSPMASNPNSTFIWSNYSSLIADNSVATTPYSLSVRSAIYPSESPSVDDFYPIPKLNRTDALVTLFFFTSNVAYLEPVDDPLFLAKTKVQKSGLTLYQANEPVAVLGCTTKFELCNLERCMNFADNQSLIPSEKYRRLQFNTKQISIADRLLDNLLSNSVLFRYVSQIGVPFLASERVYNNILQTLPPDQWMVEVNHIYGSGLNAIQQLSLELVAGPSQSVDAKYTVELPDNIKWMCSNQIVLREGYASFNVLGLAIILAVGGCLILLNLTLENIWSRVQQRSMSGRLRNAEWQDYGLLQLLRSALQGQGVGPWEGLDSDVPVTSHGEGFSRYNTPENIQTQTRTLLKGQTHL